MTTQINSQTFEEQALVVAFSDLTGFSRSLLLDSRVLGDQQLNERRKQRFASLADVVHKLEALLLDSRVVECEDSIH